MTRASQSAVSAVAAAAALTALAAVPAKADRWHYLIDDRLAEHERLLSDGIRSGAITRGEMLDLVSQLRHVKRTVRFAKRDGHLDRFERQEIRELQDDFASNLFAERNDGERRW